MQINEEDARMHLMLNPDRGDMSEAEMNPPMASEQFYKCCNYAGKLAYQGYSNKQIISMIKIYLNELQSIKPLR